MIKTNGLFIKRVKEYGLKMISDLGITREKSKHLGDIDGVYLGISDESRKHFNCPKKGELLMGVPSHWTNEDIEACIYLCHASYNDGIKERTRKIRYEFSLLMGLEE